MDTKLFSCKEHTYNELSADLSDSYDGSVLFSFSCGEDHAYLSIEDARKFSEYLVKLLDGVTK